MTELTTFLASVYDSFAEAEVQALRHGRTRLAALVESGSIPGDVAVPVYHASDVEVTLDVGLVAEETEEGTEMFVTEANSEDATELAFTVDLFELLDEGDFNDIEYDTVRSDPGDESPTGGTPAEGSENQKTERGDAEGDGTSTFPPVGMLGDIEPRYRESLRAAGIATLPDLVERSPEEIAGALAAEDRGVSPERATEWIDEARGLVAVLSEHETELPVELVDGIGPSFGSRLREGGVGDLSALAERSPEDVAELATTGDATVSPERAGRWRERAETKLEALEERDPPDGNDHGTEATGSTDDEAPTDTSVTTTEEDDQ